jgi:hypothetical protein
MSRKKEKTQIFNTDAGIFLKTHIFSEDPFEQFQNRDVETNGDVNIARNI